MRLYHEYAEKSKFPRQHLTIDILPRFRHQKQNSKEECPLLGRPGFDLFMQRPQFPISYRCLTPGTVGSCISPIHLKCLAAPMPILRLTLSLNAVTLLLGKQEKASAIVISNISTGRSWGIYQFRAPGSTTFIHFDVGSLLDPL